MRSTKVQGENLLRDRAALVRAAMNVAGCITKSDICTAAQINMVQLKNLFQKDRELYAEYVMLRRTITDIASDNIAKIINDPTHSQHFAASKYVLQNYKSDLDETLDGVDNVLQIDASGKKKDPIKITFSSSKKG